MTGLEPVTSSLPRMRSTTELRQRLRAEDETRTRNPQLGRLMLYQLSYARMVNDFFLLKLVFSIALK